MQKAYATAIFSILFIVNAHSYSPILEAKVVCLKFGEKLDAAKFDTKKIEPLRQEETCYVLTHYVKLPPEKAQEARQAAQIIYQRLGQEKK